MEYISRNAVIKKQGFIACDSCEEFTDFANCYCRYTNEEGEERGEKILLRKFNNKWKVHFQKGGSPVDASPFVNKEVIFNPDAPDRLDYLLEDRINDLTNFSNDLINIFNNRDIVVGFTPKDKIKDLYGSRYSINTTSNSLVIYSEEYSFDADIYFNFDYDEKLTSINIYLSKLSMLEYEYYAFLIQQMIEEYGNPYNTVSIPHEDLYRYHDLKFYLKSYNEELILDCSDYKISIKLSETL